jgi:hypothetical protein
MTNAAAGKAYRVREFRSADFDWMSALISLYESQTGLNEEGATGVVAPSLLVL